MKTSFIKEQKYYNVYIAILVPCQIKNSFNLQINWKQEQFKPGCEMRKSFPYIVLVKLTDFVGRRFIILLEKEEKNKRIFFLAKIKNFMFVLGHSIKLPLI